MGCHGRLVVSQVHQVISIYWFICYLPSVHLPWRGVSSDILLIRLIGSFFVSLSVFWLVSVLSMFGYNFSHRCVFCKYVLPVCGLLLFFLNSIFRNTEVFFFFNKFISFIYLFIFGCVGSSSLREGFLQLRQAGATPHRGARAPHHRSLSRCGAQAPDAQAQQLWLTGPAAPRHTGSSQTRAWTRVPRIGRQTSNHCTTREAPEVFNFYKFKLLI